MTNSIELQILMAKILTPSCIQRIAVLTVSATETEYFIAPLFGG